MKRPKPDEDRAPGQTIPVRARILNAAFMVLQERGYAATSTREIAARAKVSKRELYAQFGSKEGILGALIAARAAKMRQPLEHPDVHDRASLVATLRAFGAGFLGQLCDPAVVSIFRLAIPKAYVLLTSGAERSPEMSRALDSKARAPVRAAVEALMRQARAAGLVAGEPSAMMARFLALLTGEVHVPLLLGLVATPEPSELVRSAKAATDAILRLYGSD